MSDISSALNLTVEEDKDFRNAIRRMPLTIGTRKTRDGDDWITTEIIYKTMNGDSIGTFDDAYAVAVELGWVFLADATLRHAGGMVFNIGMIQHLGSDLAAKTLEYALYLHGRVPALVAQQMLANGVPLHVAVESYKNDIDPVLAGALVAGA